jgi:cobalt-zinc-cadmium resistance protein CzcA
MRRFVTWLLCNRLLVLVFGGGLVVAGLLAWWQLPIDAFPDVTSTQVMILAQAPGLTAVDVEQRVTYPLEQRMRGLPRVQFVRSLSKAELSQVVVVFEDGVDTWWTRQIVFERLAEVREDLPPGVEPELGPVSTGLGEVFQYTLEGDDHDEAALRELRSLQDWVVAPLLQPLAGVNEVNSFGGRVKQYQVLLDPDRLLKYGLTADDVVHAVEANNANAAGGVLVRGWEQTYLRAVGLLRDVPDIERIVLRTHDGRPVLVRDVAEVSIGSEPRQGAASRDGRGEVVCGMVIMLKGENAQQVVERVQQQIARIRGILPPGVRLDVYYDRTGLVDACIDTVFEALLEGAVFVVLVLFLFVAELRTALIVLLSLPLTFLATFVVMGRVGLSANLMSLGGLAFSVGMVVDASIVVVENVRRRLAERLEPGAKGAVVVEAVVEVGRPVAFSVLIIALILVPLYALQGIEGKMFAPLATTMLIALLASLAVALTIVPALADLLLRQRAEREFGFIRAFHRGYVGLLMRLVRHPRITGLAALAMLGVTAVVLLPRVGTEFMPALDEGAIAINVVRLPNASLDGSAAVADHLERRLRRFPEIRAVVSKTGRAEISEDPMGPEQTDLFLMLAPRAEWTARRTKQELVEAIRADLEQVPGLRLSFSQPIALRVNELISGVKSDLAVKIFGPELETIKQTADRVAAVLGAVPGAADVKVEQISGMTEYDLELDRAELARHGVAVDTLRDLLETAVAGRTATTLIEGERRFGVAVRFAERFRRDRAAVERMLVPVPAGYRVPLGQLARLREVEAPAQISRENGMRRVVVEANVRDRDLGGFVAEVQQRLRAIEQELPPGYWLSYGGQFENQQRAMQRLTIVVPAALLLIVVLLVLALGSFSRSLLVLLNLPFALVGGVVAVVAFDVPLSVSAAVAFIVLLGIAVQNGVVLVTFFRQLREQGRSVTDTVREGCDRRFRPLLMTALTSFIGHLPMLYAAGSGAEIQRPLAIVVMGGLVSCTLLTLLVLPVVYHAAAGWAERRGVPRGTRPAPPEPGGRS